MRTTLTLCAAAAVLLLPRGGATSGATRAHQTGPHHLIVLTTPSITFQDPADEQEFHKHARVELEEKLTTHRKNIERNVATLRREFKLAAYDAALPLVTEYDLESAKGPCRIDFPIAFPDMGSLELAFAAPPKRKTWESLGARIQQLFTPEQMKP